MNINAFLDYASKKYYEGSPIMTDMVFDELADENGYENVGYKLDSDIPHIFKLYSLRKVYEDEDRDPFKEYWNKTSIVVTSKLDGAAVALTYHQGRLVQALSRGDGITGKDITHNMKHIVPSRIQCSIQVDQIVGEVVAPATIPNARNYAAGALNLKDSEEFKSRDLTFIAYDINPNITESWSKDLEHLSESGFHTVIEQSWKQFPRDGKVYRLDSNELFFKQGYTGHHPRGAYALKERQVGVKTKLLDVVWQVGKSGVVSPVAILEPVKIGEATIRKATLHNMRYIDELGLEIGCDVEVIRSGEIIPRVVRRL